MISSVGNSLSEDLFDDKTTRVARQFSPDLHRAARRKLLFLHDADEFSDLKVPPGNRLEAMKGDLKGYHSIRVNDQWRIIFRWKDGNCYDVKVVDYHK